MKTVGNIVGIAVVTLVVVIVGNMILCSGPESVSPIKIGVVDIYEAFNKYKKMAVYQDLLKKEEEKEMLEIRKIEDEIKKTQKEMDELKTLEGERGMTLTNLLEVYRLQREHQIKLGRKKLAEKLNAQRAELYNDIRIVIDKYAKEKGFTLILKTEPPRIQAEEETQLTMGFRTVLYSDKALDITQDIINILNK